MANKVLKRSETDKKYTWRLEDIYPDVAAGERSMPRRLRLLRR